MATDRARVMDGIKAAIAEGRLSPGDKLPTIEELAEEYGTGQTTIKTAQAFLKAEGVLTSIHGKGVYVAEREN